MLSYAQHFEDVYLARCFRGKKDGFYIDVGAGHPVVDNVSFAFYLQGWHGIAVEPNPKLAQLTRSVRPRDIVAETLVGAQPGEATFYLVDDFHGLSTMIGENAAAAEANYGKRSETRTLPVTTLAALCAQHKPKEVDFLKIDVEGAEKDVLAGADWKNYRPKVIVIEATMPASPEPNWSGWEPLVLSQRYRFAFFDGLNRYYLAEEAAALALHFEAPVNPFDKAVQLSRFRGALEDGSHPDHKLAALAARSFLTRMPLIDRKLLVELLTADLNPAALAHPASDQDLLAIFDRLLGREPSPEELAQAKSAAKGKTLREAYDAIAGLDAVRAAMGRISGSYAW
ncbi:MAG: FkbM family methyltransferase [Xanthobacteraceae bacterium]|nr:FkbM family methyltransferase [Xanthobacteraceae bacterium]QYK45884.1 MAG: FkbM family methyltransferase [Xanthobacteraceae bacterium]